MNTPNPTNVFGRNILPRTHELSIAIDCLDAEPVIPAEPEVATNEATKARAINYTLGNHELPIALHRERIVAAVDSSQATIVTAETGAGKSTQVPQYLAEQGYEVIVTQPRVVAARSVAERVREEVIDKRGEEFGNFVGYRTARERGDNPENQILFVTDGLQLVRELSGNGVGKKQALVLDEVHEWNENMEVLVAWAKQRMNDDPDFKVVVMSATMEAGPLAKYFAENKREVPVIEVPGRTYEVKIEEGGDVSDQVRKMAMQGKNTLVFMPGKAEIDKGMADVQRANIPGVIVLPLHGELEAAEQRKVFTKYSGVKVIESTNIAQTSVTIEDIDVVVDSGLERRKEVRNGVEGLYLRPISQADCLQRAGRAGRTKSGLYILAQLDNNPFVPFADREKYGTPEILRARLDGMVLRLAKNGFDAADMDYYHSKDNQGRDIKPEIAAAKERLQKLGALREDGSVTRIGRDMERMPVESHYARMMIEARKYGPEVQMQLAALLAVQEVDGICQFESRNKVCEERWRSLLKPGINDSDMIKQLEVFIAAQTMSDRQKRDNDIFVKAFSKASEVLRQLRSVEKLRDQDLIAPSAEQREQLVKCIISGMVDNLYIDEGYDGYQNAKGDVRGISSRSIVRPNKMVVGTPFDLQINTRRGLSTLHLLESPTNVPSIDTLKEIAPQLFAEKHAGFKVGEDGAIYERFAQIFNGHDIGEEIVRLAPENTERKDYLAQYAATHYWAMPEMVNVRSAIDDLNNRIPGSIEKVSLENIISAAREALPVSVSTLRDALEYVPRPNIDDLISVEKRTLIFTKCPDSIQNIPITYKGGIPVIEGALEEDAILALSIQDFTLADGRAAHIRTGPWGGHVTLELRQQQIIKKRADYAEFKAKQCAGEIDDILYYLRQGDFENYRTHYSEDVIKEAEVIYEAEQSAKRMLERIEEERKQALSEQVDALFLRRDVIYEQVRAAESDDDVPEEIKNEIYPIIDDLNDVSDDLHRENEMLQWGHEIVVDTYEHMMDNLQERSGDYSRKCTQWHEEQKMRESQPVTAADLSALMNKFNKY